MADPVGPNVWCIGATSCNSGGDAPAPASPLCKGVDDNGYVFAAKQQARATCTLGAVDIAIQFTMALMQRKAAADIADMQEEVADEQMKLAETLHAHAKKFWVEEKELVDDAFGMARAATDYSGLPTSWKGITTDSFAAGRQDWLQNVERFCLSATPCDDARWQRMQSLMEADTLSFGARQAEARAQIQRDQRYERQYTALMMGHGMLGDTVQWQNAALALGANVHNVLVGSINSIARETGYWMQYSRPSQWSHISASQANRYLPYQPQQIAQAAPAVNVEVNTVRPDPVITTTPLAKEPTRVEASKKEELPADVWRSFLYERQYNTADDYWKVR